MHHLVVGLCFSCIFVRSMWVVPSSRFTLDYVLFSFVITIKKFCKKWKKNPLSFIKLQIILVTPLWQFLFNVRSVQALIYVFLCVTEWFSCWYPFTFLLFFYGDFYGIWVILKSIVLWTQKCLWPDFLGAVFHLKCFWLCFIIFGLGFCSVYFIEVNESLKSWCPCWGCFVGFPICVIFSRDCCDQESPCKLHFEIFFLIFFLFFVLSNYESISERVNDPS